MAQAYGILELAIVIILALSFGSFSTALAWRVPRGVPWTFAKWRKEGHTFERSSCPSCGVTLKVPDLVPLLSWLFLRGKCRYCGVAIGWVYPLIEAGVLAGALGAYASWGFTPETFIIMAAIPFFAALIAIDLEHMVLPDQLVFPLFLMGFLFFFYSEGYGNFLNDFTTGSLPRSLMGAAVYAGIAWMTGFILSRILKGDVLGMGDIKFFGTAGVWLGVELLPAFFIYSGFFGIVFGALWQMKTGRRLFPFGPAIIFGLYICIVLKNTPFTSLIGM
ncbi:MAG: prepilin peptidase [Proteobacteria bacterium]|nr:prepilin peptidase [Pseudomonadota bacterium]